jgi:hypothetical protein
MGVILGLLYMTSVLTQLLFGLSGKSVLGFSMLNSVTQICCFAAVWAIVPETGGKDFTS